MNRRQFLARTTIAASAFAAPPRIFAQPAANPRDRAILATARREVERSGAALWRRDIAAIADFGVHSAQPRFHIANLLDGTVRSMLVSHGSGSDPEHNGWLNAFSNLPNTGATSRGAYVTWEWYEGRFGSSMRLGGLEESNSNAYPRAIVMHAAEYATPRHVERWGRVGRSNGCFALDPERLGEALYLLGGGRLLFADTLGIGPDGQQVAMPPQADIEFVDTGPPVFDESELIQAPGG